MRFLRPTAVVLPNPSGAGSSAYTVPLTPFAQGGPSHALESSPHSPTPGGSTLAGSRKPYAWDSDPVCGSILAGSALFEALSGIFDTPRTHALGRRDAARIHPRQSRHSPSYPLTRCNPTPLEQRPFRPHPQRCRVPLRRHPSSSVDWSHVCGLRPSPWSFCWHVVLSFRSKGPPAGPDS